MSLRETLTAASRQTSQEADFEAKKPQMIKEWQSSIVDLNNTLREWLQEYEHDGIVSFQEDVSTIREELLGDYKTQALNIHAGSTVIRLQPVGRVIIGALGRIDMYRQGHASEGARAMLLRMAAGEQNSWTIRPPQVQRMGDAFAANPRGKKPLTRQVFEDILDELIR